MNQQLVTVSVQLVSVILNFGLPLSEGASYDDLINCEAFPGIVNFTDAELEQEALRRGQCIPYTTETFSSTTRTNPCDIFYRPGIDYVYLPSGRALGDLRRLNDIAADLNLVNDILPPQCREPATRAICYYYYPPCGNNTHFAPPNALCQDVCNYLTIDLCPEEWALALNFISGIQELLELIQLEFVNCSQPGAPLGSLPHCCSDAGIDIMPATTESGAYSEDTETTKPASDSSSSITLMAASVLLALLVVGMALVED